MKSSMFQKRLLIYGDVEMDILLKAESADADAQDVKVDEISYSPGGSASNCAAIAGSLGQPVTFIGTIGNDSWTEPLLNDFRGFNINARYVKRSQGMTGTCVSVVDDAGERKFYSYRGVNEVDPPGVPPESVWKKHHCLQLSGYSFQQPNSRQTAWSMLRTAKRNGLDVSLDPSYLFAKQTGSEMDELLAHLDFMFPNLVEAELLSGEQDPVKAARVLRGRGVGTILVTLGSDGCLLSSKDNEVFIRIDPLEKVVDTTGAGDAICGGFLTGWLKGLSSIQACKLGCAAAAHIVTCMGAHEKAPTLTDLMNILRHNHEIELVNLIENLS
jgi:sugar/nucleoside kinase (ribokinase family)